MATEILYESNRKLMGIILVYYCHVNCETRLCRGIDTRENLKFIISFLTKSSRQFLVA